MAKALRCDNCNEFFPITLTDISHRPVYSDINNIAFSASSDHNGQRLYGAYDICPACMKKVKDILPGIRKRVEQ